MLTFLTYMKTKFNEVPVQLNLPEIELKILKAWKDNNIYEKVKEKYKTAPEKVYYDGPITANAMPHYGHIIPWTAKDVIPRYWTMTGNFVSRNIGWDCQGLPVEMEVEKRLGFKSKKEVETFGIEKFNQECRNSVMEYRDAMWKYEERIGRWIEPTDTYETMSPKYIESVWWSLKELYNKDLLYEGLKVVPYSARAGTPLSNSEVALGGYKEVVDPAVTIKFKVKGKDEFLLAWTTTPWTLPGNLMLSVGRKITYCKVRSNDEVFILAKNCVERVFKDQDFTIIEEFSADNLIGMEYEPLFDYFETKRNEGCFKVIYADHVTTDDGTGLVHLAPYGAEDFDIFMKLGIKIFDYLDTNAAFNNLIPELEGKFYKQGNPIIISQLTEKGFLFKVEDYSHQMPMCWRTDTPLIYKPVKSWYVAVTKIRDQLLSENEKIKWVPENIKNGRFGVWLENARDWALSRNRYWGTPLPVWINDVTGEVIVIGSFEELSRLSGKDLPVDFDPHMPFVDEITWQDEKGGTFKRVKEVIDVWYDSGAMPFARHHYPFENVEDFNRTFPSEYIAEGVDQTRGWFYSLLVINVALFAKTPYESCLVIGMLGDEHGKKLSKSKKNYPPVDEALTKYGSEALRYYILSSPIVENGTAKFSYRLLEESKREFFPTIWNSFRYFVTYANLKGFEMKNLSDLENSFTILDKWILHRMNQITQNVNSDLTNLRLVDATREFTVFLDDLSNWYIRRSRDRLSEGDEVSMNVLFSVLYDFAKLIAPFMPLFAEELYKNLSVASDHALESVHLEKYPTSEVTIDEDLIKQMVLARQLASVASSVRKENNLPIRQPLSLLEVKVSEEKTSLSEEVLGIVKDEINVKNIVFVTEFVLSEKNWINKDDSGVEMRLNTDMTEELKLEGILREFIRELQKLRKEASVDWDKQVDVTYPAGEGYSEVIAKFEEQIKQKTLVKSFIKGSEFKIY
ncbi:MAG: isoleucyl-tRNA synthetase [Patescibacteria group bacterium]|nr:isoleucyl-tRNA synthetase [Patescibacteria group bacterium]